MHLPATLAPLLTRRVAAAAPAPLLTRRVAVAASAALALTLGAAPLAAQHLPGHVLEHRYLSEGLGGFGGQLENGDAFGRSVCSVGDIDGDGVDDLAVGAPETDVPASALSSGRVWILFMNADGTVAKEQPLDALNGDLPFALVEGDRFGSAVEAAGDLNGDGIPDLWVGARGDDTTQAPDPNYGPGAVRALMLDSDGTVKSAVKLSSASAGITLGGFDAFGTAIAAVGDLDGDGTDDLVVGAPGSHSGGPGRGAVWIVLLNADLSVASATRVSALTEPALAALPTNAYWGWSVEGLGDIDGNGTPDFAVGAPDDDVLGTSDGSLWFVRTGGGLAIQSLTRFAADAAVFGGAGPDDFDRFGRSIARLGDLDLDGHVDIAVGASNGGDLAEGTVWILRLGGPVSFFVKSATPLNHTEGFVPFPVWNFSFFGFGLGPAGDLDGDGTPDLLVGMTGANDGGTDAGAVVTLRLRGPTFVELGGSVGPGGGGPTLGADGLLVGGEPLHVQLKNGPSFGAATAVVGFSEIHAPFKGGVMVPAPDQLLSSFPLDADGRLEVGTTWPAGIPLGTTLTLQLWMPDSSAPAGASGSNAVRFVAGA